MLENILSSDVKRNPFLFLSLDLGVEPLIVSADFQQYKKFPTSSANLYHTV